MRWTGQVFLCSLGCVRHGHIIYRTELVYHLYANITISLESSELFWTSKLELSNLSGECDSERMKLALCSYLQMLHREYSRWKAQCKNLFSMKGNISKIHAAPKGSSEENNI
jgi:hypothetical protein